MKLSLDVRPGSGESAFTPLMDTVPVCSQAPPPRSSAGSRYRVEPYVIAADVYGHEPHVGRGGWTWYTGAASWAWRLGIEAILGIRLVAGELEVNPCLPSTWGGFQATVKTARATLHITVEDPDGLRSGTFDMHRNGHPVESGRIPLADLEGEHEIHLVLGGTPKPQVRA